MGRARSLAQRVEHAQRRHRLCSRRSTPRRARPGSSASASSASGFRRASSARRSIPCPNPNGGAALTSDTMNHVGGTLSLSASLAKLGAGTLDAYGSIMAYANSDSANKPSLLQVLGDMNLGAQVRGAGRQHRPPRPLLRSSGSSTAPARSVSTATAPARSSAASAPSTCAVSRAHVPLRFSVNAVYFLDNSSDVLGPTEPARGTPVTRIERYGLGVNRVDQFQLFIGGEAFAGRRAGPAVRRGEDRRPEQPPGLPLQDEQPEQATMPGERPGRPVDAHHRQPLLPVEARLLAARRGRHRHRRHERLHRGAAAHSAVDALPRRRLGGRHAGPAAGHQDQDVEKPVEHVAPHGHVIGFVHEKDKNDPIVGAIVSVPRPHRPHAARDGRRTASSPTICRRARTRSTSRPTGTSPARATRPCPRRAAACTVDCAARGAAARGHRRRPRARRRHEPADRGRAGRSCTTRRARSCGSTTDPSGGFKFDARLARHGAGQRAGRRVPRPRDADGREGRAAENTLDLMLRPKPKHVARHASARPRSRSSSRSSSRSTAPSSCPSRSAC